MSVVAVKIYDETIMVSADSILVYGWTQLKLKKDCPGAKLYSTNGMIIGSCGYAEESQLFFLYASTHKPAGTDDLSIVSWLSEFADWKNKKVGKYEIENSCILVFDDTVWVLDGMYSRRVPSFAAIGAGGDFALAALHLSKSPSDAVQVACELSVMCETPVNTFIYDRKTKTIQ